MAIRKAGMRRLVVDGVEYLWKFPRKRDHGDRDCLGGCHALVCRPDRCGSVLYVTFPQYHPGTAPGLFPVVPVLPSHIAPAIRRAVTAGWLADAPGSPFWIAGVAPDAEPGATADGGGHVGLL